MPELEWNRVRWNDEHPWPESGDEWSAGWGGPRAQWYGTIFPRIARWLPAARVLEIAPGFGRWTQFLLRQCDELYGVDLNPKCIQRCVQRFSAYNRAHFVQNDGFSLGMVADNTIDLVFSFDSLVRGTGCGHGLLPADRRQAQPERRRFHPPLQCGERGRCGEPECGGTGQAGLVQ